jgi:hypothetical protein
MKSAFPQENHKHPQINNQENQSRTAAVGKNRIQDEQSLDIKIIRVMLRKI